jgi:hypothetical protein
MKSGRSQKTLPKTEVQRAWCVLPVSQEWLSDFSITTSLLVKSMTESKCVCLAITNKYRPVSGGASYEYDKEGYFKWKDSCWIKDAGPDTHKFYIKIDGVSRRIVADHKWWFTVPGNIFTQRVAEIRAKYGKKNAGTSVDDSS